MTDPFPPNLQNIMPPKPLELESQNFDRMFTPRHVFKLSVGGGGWRVCYPALSFTIYYQFNQYDF